MSEALKIGDRVEVKGREVCGRIEAIAADSAFIEFEDDDGYGWYATNRIRKPLGRSKPWAEIGGRDARNGH